MGLFALFLGTLVYLTDRPPQSTYFVREWLSWTGLYNIWPDLFGWWDRSLASFLHVFSFIMITAGLVAPSPRSRLAVCLGWFTVDGLFEAGQHFDTLAVSLVPTWFDHWPFLETCRDYFSKGSYDPADMAAICAGALAGWLLLGATTKK